MDKHGNLGKHQLQAETNDVTSPWEKKLHTHERQDRSSRSHPSTTQTKLEKKTSKTPEEKPLKGRTRGSIQGIKRSNQENRVVFPRCRKTIQTISSSQTGTQQSLK